MSQQEDMASRDLSPAISGVVRGKAQPWPPERQARLVELASSGMTGSEIAAALGTTRNAILGRCHRSGVRLPLDDRKRAMVGRGRRSPRTPQIKGSSKFPVGHPSRTSRPMGTRAFSDTQIAVAIAARLAGQSRPKAARQVGASAQSLKIWERKAALMAAGRALYETARADAAERAAIKRQRAAAEAAAEAERMERTNAPLFERMTVRDHGMMTRRVAGQTLQEVGDAFGVTRERVRQIEVRWRLAGLIVPGTRAVSDAARAVFGELPKMRLSDAERARRAEWARSMVRARWANADTSHAELGPGRTTC